MPFDQPDSWNQRYAIDGGFVGAGTRTHSEAGNVQFYRIKFRAVDRCLKKAGASFAGKRVLDAAGGTGQFLPYYLARGASHVTIADFSEEAVQQVRQAYGHDDRVAACQLDLRAASVAWEALFDYVLVMEAIFLLPSEAALRKAIQNLAASLAPGGHLIISDLFPEATFRENEYVIRHSRQVFENLLAEFSLETKAYVPQTFFFNRNLFGRLQELVERSGTLYYADRLAISLGFRSPQGTPADTKYLVAQKT